MRPADLPHLTRRFFGSWRARRPSAHHQAMVAATLSESAARLFFAQPAMDQQHGIAVAQRVAAQAPGRADLFRAALLHDVGKTPSGLGVIGRSVASVLAMARLPAPGRLRSYLDHGPHGAELLAAAGESGIVVAFARDHRRTEAPPGTASADWAVLRAADHE